MQQISPNKIINSCNRKSENKKIKFDIILCIFKNYFNIKKIKTSKSDYIMCIKINPKICWHISFYLYPFKKSTNIGKGYILSEMKMTLSKKQKHGDKENY